MSSKGIRTALAVIAILTGIIVALVTGILVRSGGGSVTSAGLSGGGAFGATVVLVLTITKFLDLVPLDSESLAGTGFLAPARRAELEVLNLRPIEIKI
jgi:Zn-dependent protease